MLDIKSITRKNILKMKPYSSAREEYKGEASVWLDANENPNNTNLNRYPDPLQYKLKQKIATLKGVSVNQIFVGNGSDEAIDLLFRAFCEPSESKIITFPPTYGMYQVAADINNIEVIKLPLTDNFQLPSLELIAKNYNQTGLLFICSPNNPTGNSFEQKRIIEIAKNYKGLVVIDEAYIDFSDKKSALNLLAQIENLVVLQTFSKAYGLAGARVGMAFAHEKIIEILNKIKPPYNVNTLSIEAAIQVIENKAQIEKQLKHIKSQKLQIINSLNSLEQVVKVYPSDSNFLLVQFKDSDTIFQSFIDQGIVVRNRTHEIKNCLRITIGTKTENEQIITLLTNIQ